MLVVLNVINCHVVGKLPFIKMNVFESTSDSDCMDFSRLLPYEILEEIFSYLTITDLAHCSIVSVKWRDAANSDKLWRSICEKLSWQQPVSLSDIESNFLNKRYQFLFPSTMDRISPVSDWKLYYCQQKFLSYNWHRGRYVTHWFGKNIKVPRTLTFVSNEPNERLLFPIVERVGYHYEFSVVRIDGKPTKICRLEKSTVDDITVICVAENTIAYVAESLLKVASYHNGDFSVVYEYSLTNCIGELNINAYEEVQSCAEPRYFIKMNSTYMIAGLEPYYFYVWDRKSSDKIGFVECPVPNSVISTICLHDDRVYFGISEKNAECHEVYEYSVIKKHLTLICTVSFVVKKIITNSYYLIIVVVLDVNRNEVLVYDRATMERETSFIQDTSENWAVTEPQVLLAKDLLFCLQSLSIKVMIMPSCKTKAEFKVTSTVYSIYNVRNNLMVVKTRNEVEVWDWQQGIKLYTPCIDCDTSYLYHDMTRLTLIQQNRGEAKVIGFW